jgi:beta-lactamase regulating signal transducer with metallopeptidase domain
MSVLIAIALKSLLVSGLTLGLLALLRRRSAAERSWVAHIGLLALIIMAFAPLALPRWNVEAPALFTPAPAASPVDAAPSTTTAPPQARPSALPAVVAPSAASRMPTISASAAASAIYAVPAAILLFITFLALARLLALRARAEILVDGHWLTALARAQKRMGFKHGTALLTSNALASPVSWGLVRPVILLNTRAVEASNEAEAILAHELAHVARMDWAKLVLARVATALFWFNPLVWVLAREAHQLREETADDAVLAADIADTDYAQLLVGVARHECPGLLLGAHGVAPSKSPLARRQVGAGAGCPRFRGRRVRRRRAGRRTARRAHADARRPHAHQAIGQVRNVAALLWPSRRGYPRRSSAHHRQRSLDLGCDCGCRARPGADARFANGAGRIERRQDRHQRKWSDRAAFGERNDHRVGSRFERPQKGRSQRS